MGDLNIQEPGVEPNPVFLVANNVFCVLFTAELVIRFLACEHKCQILVDAWFAFDLVLVVMMVVETWVVPIIMAIVGNMESGALANASVLRLLRLLRISKMAKAMRAVPELLVMIKGLAAGLRSVLAATALLCGITYLFAVLFRQLASGTDMGEEFFSSVPLSLYSLLCEAMFPDNAETMTNLGTERWYLGVLFFFFLCMAGLCVLNMLVGVMCDVMTTGASERKEALMVANMAVKLQDILTSMFGTFDGYVSQTQFEALVDDEEVIQLLTRVGVDVHSLIEGAEAIYQQCSEQGLTFSEFVEVVSQRRATTAATNRVVSGLRDFVCTNLPAIEARLSAIEEALRQDTDRRLASNVGLFTVAKHP